MMKFFLPSLVLVLALLVSSCEKDDPISPEEQDPSANTEDTDSLSSEYIWSTNLTHTVQTTTNHYPAIDDNGNIYLLTKEYGVGSIIQAIDKDGNELWKKTKEKYPRNYTTSYYNGNIYFLTTKELVCLNADSGDEEWIISESIEDDLHIGNQNNFAFVGNNLIIPLLNIKGTHLVKIDPSTGLSNGSIKISKQNRVVPRLASKGNNIYIAEDSLFMVNESGIVWSTNIANTESTTKDVYDMAIIKNNDIVISTKSEMNNEKKVLLYKNNNLVWSHNFDSNVLTPSISELNNDNIILSMGDLININPTNGNEKWKLESEILKSFETTNIASNGIIYGGNAYGIWGIDKDGNTIYEFDANGDPLSNSILQNGGNIIVLSMGTANSLIHCIKQKNTDGIKTDVWAKWGANATNTFNVN